MERSLQRVITLPANTKVYPGHGPVTTIGAGLPNLKRMREMGVLPGLRV
jgi:glyoxylase-like metal-dependent hydrolase (beta-lactamase superfamily II)